MFMLSEELVAKIRVRTEQGDIWAEDGDYLGAIEEYEAALLHVPSPVTDYEASTWIYTAIGDARFLLGDFPGGCEAMSEAVRCPGGLGNPFVHLRLGQCRYELGEMERAADELARAYMGDGERVFENDDPKYFELVQSKLKGVGDQVSSVPHAGAPSSGAPAANKPWWKFW